MTEFQQLDLHTRLPQDQRSPAPAPTPTPAPAPAKQNGSQSPVNASPVLPGSKERIAAERLADVAERLLTSLALPAERDDLREAITGYRSTTA